MGGVELTVSVNLLPTDQGLFPPRPIIIDRALKTLPTARILQPEEPVFDVNGQKRNIRLDPWFICAKSASAERRLELEKMGAKVIPVDVDERGMSNHFHKVLYAPVRCGGSEQ